MTAFTLRGYQGIKMQNPVDPGPDKVGFMEAEPGLLQIINKGPVLLVPLGSKGLPRSIKVLWG